MNRTDEGRALAVVRARLPYIDRRALSQAWFSALHLASGERGAPRVAHAEGSVAGRPRSGSQSAPVAPRATSVPLAGAVRGNPLRANSGSVSSARAELRVARRMRAVASPALPGAVAPDGGHGAAPGVRDYPAFRTSLSFGVAGERVQLLLRREGATLQVIALCRPAVEPVVRRALALAAAHVWLQGDRLRADVRVVAEARA